MHIRRQNARHRIELLEALDLGRIPGKLFGSAAGHLIIGLLDVGECDRLRAMLAADPIGVRQIDAHRRRRRGISGLPDNIDGPARDTRDIRFLVLIGDGRVVLKPLRLGSQRLDTLRGDWVDELNDRLVRSAQANRIVVDLYEPDDRIDCRLGVCDPGDVVFVPVLEVTAAKVGDELLERIVLQFVLGNRQRVLEPIDDTLEGLRVEAADMPGLLDDLAVDVGEP